MTVGLLQNRHIMYLRFALIPLILSVLSLLAGCNPADPDPVDPTPPDSATVAFSTVAQIPLNPDHFYWYRDDAGIFRGIVSWGGVNRSYLLVSSTDPMQGWETTPINPGVELQSVLPLPNGNFIVTDQFADPIREFDVNGNELQVL